MTQWSSVLIRFIAGVITFFVVGSLINYFHRGARGVEIIPFWTFWKDLPFLIKVMLYMCGYVHTCISLWMLSRSLRIQVAPSRAHEISCDTLTNIPKKLRFHILVKLLI